MGHIYFIMGVSGSGKGTLISNIKKLKLPNIHIPLSYKTRPIRANEVEGVDGFFISKEEFFSQVQEGKFLEYALVHESDYYGTKFDDVIEKGIHSKKIVLKEIDINGLENLRKDKPELDERYTTIFLNIPENILKERIEKRGAFMSDEELEKRINSSIIEEQKAKKWCDYIIDATKSETEVLQEVLTILNNRNSIIDNIFDSIENRNDGGDIDNIFDSFNIILEGGEVVIEFLKDSGEVVGEFIGGVFSSIDF